jgi:hypothetical protein
MFYSYMQVEYLLPILQILIVWGWTLCSIWSWSHFKPTSPLDLALCPFALSTILNGNVGTRIGPS